MGVFSGLVGVYIVDIMTEQEKRKLVSRLHRLEGQVRALEKQLDSDDPLTTCGQFDAVIAAAQSSLVEYLSIVLQQSIPQEEKNRLIKRLVRR